jgi:hypothetical protein
MPNAVNMYLTAPGNEVSAPPHTDKQDVFVLQTQGSKHWRVFSPPPPSRMPRADPFARGKGPDKLDIRELDEPLIDTVLSPGQILYVPAGFPHTTDTVQGVEATEPSVHLTFGLDSYIWRLSYASLRAIVLRRAGEPDKLSDKLQKLESEKYWTIQGCLPLGFFSKSNTENENMAISITLVKMMRGIEPTRWAEELSDIDIATSLDTPACVQRIFEHHARITDIFTKMYADVSLKLTPVNMDLSFFRSKPYLEELEREMESLEKWTAPKGKVKNTKKNKKARK